MPVDDLPPLTPWQLQLQRWGLEIHALDPPLGPHSVRDGVLGFAMRRTDWTLWTLMASCAALTGAWLYGVAVLLLPDPELALYGLFAVATFVVWLARRFSPEVHYGVWVEARELEVATGRHRVQVPLDALQRVTRLHRSGHHGVVLHCGPQGAFEVWLARDQEQAEAIVAWFTRFIALYRRRWGSDVDVPDALKSIRQTS